MQANYLRQLNQKGDPEAVIRQYEGGRINSTEATLGEYVKALVKVDRLDSTALAHTLQVFLLTNLIACKLVSQLMNSMLSHLVCKWIALTASHPATNRVAPGA